ncbi:serine carboxypeptidase-like 40 [Ricinus communis]|uniref:serine carboxypeptidase-like 40 n=1 Tax=Ricinus communis TaxID=3988 RepID=UPI00201A789F|nr:serine carboxypeptidase-like 40 [Ricinus communis]
MKNNPCFVLVFFLIVSCFIDESHGKRQGDALNKLFKAKFSGNSNIDTSSYEVFDQFQAEKIRGLNKTSINTVIASSETGSKEADRIVRLPGQPQVKFSQYGGYITVDKVAGRAYYYYFVEAEISKSLPLLLWLNGGPGCSSLAYGAMQELGPFRVHSDGKTLYSNQFAWNNVANVLFLESPAGVGFSYSNRTSDYNNSGDRHTAADNYMFLLRWLERFPEYKDRDFYISGESYAGHYVPQLAHNILYHNRKAGKNIINLKGIAIGNAVINDETDSIGMYDYFATHALTSPENVQNIKQHCNFSPQFKNNQSSECLAATRKSDRDTVNIDIYNIYAPLCHNSNLAAKPKRASLTEFDPCSDYYSFAYFNRADVQEAMHANVTKLNHVWDLCSVVLGDWKDSPSTILPLLQEFMSSGLRVWVYSGDTDGRVPVTSTQYSINKMNLPTKTPWYPWALDGEVGGYAQVYKGDLTFATVRGAGHEVPAYQPARALSLIKNFLSGQPLPQAAF